MDDITAKICWGCLSRIQTQDVPFGKREPLLRETSILLGTVQSPSKFIERVLLKRNFTKTA